MKRNIYVSVDEEPTINMMNTFIQSLQEKIPCISVQALHIESIAAIGDVLARGIPILFLDSRKRENDIIKYIQKGKRNTIDTTKSIKNAQNSIKKVKNTVGQFDWYTSGQISLLNKIIKGKINKSKEKDINEPL